MFLRKYGYVLLAFCFSLSLTNHSMAADNGPDEFDKMIMHTPVMKSPENMPIVIEANFSTSINEVLLFYRKAGDPAFTAKPMYLNTQGVYSAMIDDLRLKQGEAVEYYIKAFDLSNDVISYPREDPELMPSQIMITGPKQEGSDEMEIIILSPEPDVVSASADFLIAVSIFTEEPLEAAKFKLMLDGNDITAKSDVTPELITYTPKNIAPGSHVARLWYTYSKEDIRKLVEWSFEVEQGEGEDITQDDRPGIVTGTKDLGKTTGPSFDPNGKFTASYRSEFRGQENLGETTNFFRNGVNVTYEKSFFRIQGKLEFDSQDDDKKGQPLNRYYIGGNLGGLLYAQYGDVYPTLNPFVLFGTRVRGFYGAVKTGFINVEYVSGDMRRDVLSKSGQTSLKNVLSASADSLRSVSFLNDNTISDYAFKRKVTAGRFSLGPESFQLGISVAKVEDDVKSLDYTSGTSAFFTGAKPEESLSAGTSFKMTAFDRRFQFDAAVATGIRNTDITGGTLGEEEFDDLGIDINQSAIDKAKKFMTINGNLRPLPIDKNGDLDISSNLFAATVGGSLLAYNNNLRIRWRRHGGYYETLGASFQPDIKRLEFSDRIRMWDNKVFFTINYANQENNLADNNALTLTTNTLGFQLSLFLPNQMPSFALGYTKIDRDNDFPTVNATDPEFIDVAFQNGRPEENTTNVFSFGTNFNFQMMSLRHSATLNVSTTKRTDNTKDLFSLNTPLVVTNDVSAQTNFYYIKPGDSKGNSFGLTLATSWNIPLRTSVSFNLVKSQNPVPDASDTTGAFVVSETNSTIFGLTGIYGLRNTNDMKWDLNGNLGLASTSFKNLGAEDASLLIFGFGSKLSFKRQHYFFLNLSFTSGIKIPEIQGGVPTGKFKSVTNRVLTARYEFLF